jgi:DNA (cytosine-5)-methyltransferase 1
MQRESPFKIVTIIVTCSIYCRTQHLLAFHQVIALSLTVSNCTFICKLERFHFISYKFFPFKFVDDRHASSETSTISSELEEVSQAKEHHKTEVTLLDLYSGCGAMSTGLCLGANLSGLNLVTVSSIFLLSYLKYRFKSCYG